MVLFAGVSRMHVITASRPTTITSNRLIGKFTYRLLKLSVRIRA